MGLNEVPTAGDIFRVVPSEKDARAVVMASIQDADKTASDRKAHITLEQLFDAYQAGEVRELRLILKVDVQGSLEPIESSLQELGSEEITIQILHAETGNITENDVMLAAASKAIVIGFSVQADAAARRLAESEGVSIRLYDIIYRMVEDVEKALKGMLAPEEREIVLGHADVRAVFRISKLGNIAGCYVTDGELRRNARVRVLRAGQIIAEGDTQSLKHLQEDVREVRQGFECGLAMKSFSEFAVGDRIEAFIREKVAAG
jgi:translation initiation factor IF-2